jgi:hypothetical protein
LVIIIGVVATAGTATAVAVNHLSSSGCPAAPSGLDAPSGPTVSYSYTSYRVTSNTELRARRGPAVRSCSVVRTYPPGSTVQVVCQTPGEKVKTTSVWDKLSDGTYISDLYVSTPSKTTYSPPLPRCS